MGGAEAIPINCKLAGADDGFREGPNPSYGTAGAAGTRHSPRPQWAEDSCTTRAHRAAGSRAHIQDSASSLRGAQRRSNPLFLCAARWIASLRSQWRPRRIRATRWLTMTMSWLFDVLAV